MPCVAVVGAQWGDEGKGKIVDFYTEFADMVVRWGGGPNAGHTLVVGDEKVIVRLLPSGILREGTRCVIGQGMVLDLAVLFGEIDDLERRGRRGVAERLVVSNRAHLVLPYHILVDTLRDEKQGIGTTKKGIGPSYEDKVRRTGIRTGDLLDLSSVGEKVRAALEQWAPFIEAYGQKVPSVDSVVAPLEPLARRLAPLLGDTSLLVSRAIADKKAILMEGAQGTLLDIDHGTYPFVTSSSPVSGGAAVGAGIGPNRIDSVVGIAKAYSTRVGGGPFPTELLDADGIHLREAGAEFGSVTGRPRRTGWLDLPGLRYAARVNGMDGLALTKLDVLTGLRRLKVCVGYDTPSGRTDDLPIDLLHLRGKVTPIYEELAGWTEPLGSVEALDDLPKAARDYVEFLAAGAGVPLYLVSVGARRKETIVLHHPFAGRTAP
jgi:adenylosuccinate synthase